MAQINRGRPVKSNDTTVASSPLPTTTNVLAVITIGQEHPLTPDELDGLVAEYSKQLAAAGGVPSKAIGVTVKTKNQHHPADGTYSYALEAEISNPSGVGTTYYYCNTAPTPTTNANNTTTNYN